MTYPLLKNVASKVASKVDEYIVKVGRILFIYRKNSTKKDKENNNQ